MLAITTYCTKNYTYALATQMPLVVANLRNARLPRADFPVHFIMAGDQSDEVKNAFTAYEAHLEPMGIQAKLIALKGLPDANGGAHKKATNLGIARMQAAAWDMARRLSAELCWSLESDILPEPKTLRVMMGALDYDPDWYHAVMATYPNSTFLGGRGTPHRWILPNVFPDEKRLPLSIQKRLEKKKQREMFLEQTRQSFTEEDLAEWQAIDKAIEDLPAEANVWGLNGRRWRQRGWLDSAYPGTGRGALLPTDWMGLGCTLMSRKALDLAHFTGYNGACTQDLWLCWRAWNAAKLRLAVTTHALCSHVKMRFIPKVMAAPVLVILPVGPPTPKSAQSKPKPEARHQKSANKAKPPPSAPVLALSPPKLSSCVALIPYDRRRVVRLKRIQSVRKPTHGSNIIQCAEPLIAEPERREYFIHIARHELGGECDGHLRVDTVPWDGI